MNNQKNRINQQIIVLGKSKLALSKLLQAIKIVAPSADIAYFSSIEGAKSFFQERPDAEISMIFSEQNLGKSESSSDFLRYCRERSPNAALVILSQKQVHQITQFQPGKISYLCIKEDISSFSNKIALFLTESHNSDPILLKDVGT